MRPRQAYDRQPEAVRRAYYGLSNYVFAAEEAAHPDTATPIVLDRFWTSTGAGAHAGAQRGRGARVHATRTLTSVRREIVRAHTSRAPAAYAIARAVTALDDVAPADDPVYRWPDDLPVPRAVLFLNAPAAVRAGRIAARGQGFTAEEILLNNAASGLADRIGLAYERLLAALAPTVAVQLDASQPADAVLAEALTALSTRGVGPSAPA